MDEQLLMQMERLRDKMVEKAITEKNLLHRDVLVLSQSLDQIIVKVQSEQRELALARRG